MKQAILTRILLLSAIFGTTILMASNAQAMGSDDSLNLQYEALEGETLFAVATADGDFRFFNQGPSTVQLSWYDALSGEQDERVIEAGKSLVTYGDLGAEVSEGTIILVETVGPSVIAKGIASLPTTSSLHDSVHCFSNGAFLPWHRGLYLGDDAELHNSPEDSALLLVGDEPRDISHAANGLQSRSPIDFILALEHGPGMHDSVHCLVGGTMCSARVLDEAIRLVRDTTIGIDGHCQEIPYANSEGVIAGQGIGAILAHGPGLQESMYIDDASSNFGGQEGASWTATNGHALWSILDPGMLSLEHGPGLHDSVHCFVVALGWEPCPPYEPCADVDSYEPAGQVYFNPDGATFTTGDRCDGRDSAAGFSSVLIIWIDSGE